MNKYNAHSERTQKQADGWEGARKVTGVRDTRNDQHSNFVNLWDKIVPKLECKFRGNGPG